MPRAAALLLGTVLLLVAVGTGAPTASQPWKPLGREAVTDPPDYAEWEERARRAEALVGSEMAPDSELESLRDELLTWRSLFLEAQGINESRIASLRAQLEALGQPPVEGETEPEAIAAQRETLNDELERLLVPVRRAEVAYRRADSLISRIDEIVRTRQAENFLRAGPSPLYPANWRAGVAALHATFAEIWEEVAANWQSPPVRDELGANLPAISALLLLGAVLLLRGGQWFEWLAPKALRIRSRRGRGTLEFLTSLGQIALPFVGLLAALQALELSGLLGVESAQLVGLLPLAGLSIFVARWLAVRTFPEDDGRSGALTLTQAQFAEGRIHALVLGVIFALGFMLNEFAELGHLNVAARAVLNFPLLVLACALLARMGLFLLAHVRAEDAMQEDISSKTWLLGLFGRALIAIGAICPLLAAFGYNVAAISIVYPAVLSLALLGLLNILQKFVADLYTLVTGQDAGAADALLPVLLGFALTLLSLPVFALIWGARVADLLELWARFRAGFMIGGTRISPGDFLTFAVVFAIGYTMTRVVQGTMRATVLPKTKLDVGGRNAIVAGLGYLGIFLAGLLAVTAAGIDLSSLAIVAGALSVGIGFGLQNVVSNFVSGIILLIERPISEGDWIEVGPNMGYVRDISVRSTRIETFDRTDVIVPNADLVSGTVTNYTRGKLTGRVIVPVGVARTSDTHRVAEILQEIAEAHPQVVLNPPPVVYFQGFGDCALLFEIRAILRDVNWILEVKSAMNFEIVKRFAAEGVEIPVTMRDVRIRNPELLAGGTRAEPLEDPTPEPAPQALAAARG